MATSGSFDTNKVGEFYCTVFWYRGGYNATKNENYIKYEVIAHNAAGKYRNLYNRELTINNNRIFYETNPKSFYDGNIITSGEIIIKGTNNAGDSSISITFKAGVGTSTTYNTTGSGSWNIDRIPRYATSNQSVAGKTETTITMNWSSDNTIDAISYSIDNGSTWRSGGSVNSKSGSYTITGLSANTTYNIKTRVRRKDSQLTTDSSALAVTTYNFPYATTMPSFVIGDAVTIGLYNPLKRNCTVTMIGSGGSIIYSGDGWTGTSVGNFATATIITNLYNSIPNSKSATYQIKVQYSSSTITKTGGTYSINSNICIPSTGTFTYQDTNNTTTNITTNNQLIVQNNSILQITITNAQAKNGATLSKATINLNGNIIDQNFASGATSMNINIGTINVSNNLTVPITITDSRGLSKTSNLTVQVIPWSLPTAIITLERQSNYYTTTYLNVDAQYSSLNDKNTITIKYQIKKTSDATYGSQVTIQDNVQTEFQADNQYDWNVKITLTDKLGTTTYNMVLQKGIPIIYFDKNKNSTGFNCFPADEESVEIDGMNMSKVTVKNFTYNTNYFNNVIKNDYVRYGKVVQLTFIGYTSQDIPNGTVIISNIPRNAIAALRIISYTGTEYKKTAIGNNCYITGNDGVIKTFGESANKWLHLDMTYITSE